jgi:DNA-binding NarL/FixJ family response regulator
MSGDKTPGSEREIYSVVIVEDEPMARQRLAAALAQHPNFTLSAVVGSCAEARAALAETLPRAFLVDLGLPDGDGIELIREVTGQGQEVDVMVITVFGDEKHVLAALKAGATGYLLKDSASHDIGEAVLQLINGGSPISPSIARYLLKRFHQQESPKPVEAGVKILTEREREVLSLIVKGFSYKEIAGLLAMSSQTVPSHIKSIYRKLAVHSRSEAVFEAVQSGLVRFDK